MLDSFITDVSSILVAKKVKLKFEIRHLSKKLVEMGIHIVYLYLFVYFLFICMIIIINFFI